MTRRRELAKVSGFESCPQTITRLLSPSVSIAGVVWIGSRITAGSCTEILGRVRD